MRGARAVASGIADGDAEGCLDEVLGASQERQASLRVAGAQDDKGPPFMGEPRVVAVGLSRGEVTAPNGDEISRPFKGEFY